jgi:acyl-CoA dehydrogenase
VTPFGEEHDQLRAAVRRWVEEELTPHVPAWEEVGAFPDEVFRRAGELGFLGLTVPPEYGGQGADYWATVVFAEELARCGAGSIPMAMGVQTDMATPPILKFGTADQKARWLVPAVRGEKIGAIGITEPDAGSDVARIRTRARRDGDGWLLDGRKLYITNGARADFVTLVARTRELDPSDPWSGLSLFIVPMELDGATVARTLDKVGMRASDTAELVFEDVHLPADALLGEEGQGFPQIMWELQGERLIAAIQCVGSAALAVEWSVAYARERHAFGKPIARFQALKHKLVDMATAVETVRRLVYDAADKWNRGLYATTEIAMCKLAAARMVWEVVDDALQVHGGYGYSEEYPIARLWRDVRLMRIGGGTDEVQREVVAKLIGAGR